MLRLSTQESLLQAALCPKATFLYVFVGGAVIPMRPLSHMDVVEIDFYIHSFICFHFVHRILELLD